MIVHLIVAMQVTAVQPSPKAAAPTEQPIIWRDLRRGITPEQFAENLRKADGVKSVEVIRRGKKPAKVNIDYTFRSGLPIGDLTVNVVPVFVDDRLDSVLLNETECFSAVEAKVKALFVALNDKYPQQQSVTVVDDDGVPTDKQQAFFNENTRVTVSVTTIENPYPRHTYGGSGFIAAANNLVNSMADSNYNSAIAACPVDKGRKATLQLEYVAQEDFRRKHAMENAEREAKARATKEGL